MKLLPQPTVDLDMWDPEDEAHWDKGLAWRTLWVTTYSMLLAFAVWYMVSAIAPRLNDVGFDLDDNQLYLLVAVTGLAGGSLRLVFMFLPPIVGTRTLVGGSTTLLLLPVLGWSFAVLDSSTPYGVLLLLAAAAGVGGGSFSGFMPSTSYFFPRRLVGTAMGLQAGIGNFGMSVIQFLVPWIVGFGLLGTAVIIPEQVNAGDGPLLHNAGLVLIPWVVLAMILSAVYLRRVPINANFRQQFDIFRDKHTWIMTIVYVMTFGVFSGFSAQLGLIIRSEYGSFADAPDPLKFAFLAPLVGALTRAAWGPLCDKFGGAVWTLVAGIGMTISTLAAMMFLNPTDVGQFPYFLAFMLVMLFFTGVGNAGTFKQIPMIFERRQAGGVIGFTSSIAAFGPFIVGAGLVVMSPQAFYIGTAIYCAITTALVWWYYARPGAPKPG